MKYLTITALDGNTIGKCLVNVEGDNFDLNLTIPIFLPIINISLLEIDKKEAKRIRETLNRVRSIVE